jgi:hypothetical protein
MNKDRNEPVTRGSAHLRTGSGEPATPKPEPKENKNPKQEVNIADGFLGSISRVSARKSPKNIDTAIRCGKCPVCILYILYY